MSEVNFVVPQNATVLSESSNIRKPASGDQTDASLVAGELTAKTDPKREFSKAELEVAAAKVSDTLSEISSTSLSFSVVEELSRMVVAVRSVGSDKVIRQFPPEEFISVAKFISSQDPSSIDEDFLKGILHDSFS